MIWTAIEAGITVGHAAARQVTFHADDGFDAGVAAGTVEVEDAEHHAMIGNAQRGHFQFFGARHQVFDAALAIKQGKFAMDVEMDEIAGHSVDVERRRYGFQMEKRRRIITPD